MKHTHISGLPAFDWEAHRGGRGLLPENTIPAMLHTIDLGVTTLEMDAVISKDNKVVVSHDPFFNEVITTTPQGEFLTKAEAESRLLYQMDYDSIRKYDVGMKPHPGFPHQKKLNAYKPLLSDLIDAAEQHAREKKITIRYNIEIKSVEGYDGIRHPAPDIFSELVLQVIKDKGIRDRTIIQSFDTRALQYLHSSHPEIKLSYLMEQTNDSFDLQLQRLGFIPAIYSPEYTMVTKDVVAQCHMKGIKIIPWTINQVTLMKDLIAAGVDGLISDYPDLYAALK